MKGSLVFTLQVTGNTVQKSIIMKSVEYTLTEGSVNRVMFFRSDRHKLSAPEKLVKISIK